MSGANRPADRPPFSGPENPGRREAVADWEALRAPFPEFEVGWRVENRSPDGRRGRARAVMGSLGVLERLDAVLGPEGWSRTLSVASLAPPAVHCRLKLGPLERDALGEGESLHEAGERAFVRAAAAFGVGRYLERLPPYWVRLEPDSDLPDELPTLPTWAVPGPEPAARANEAQPREAQPQEARPRDDRQTLAGHRLVDRFLEQLRQVGLEREAALVVSRAGGYGQTPEAARRLCSELARLLERGARQGKPGAERSEA